MKYKLKGHMHDGLAFDESKIKDGGLGRMVYIDYIDGKYSVRVFSTYDLKPYESQRQEHFNHPQTEYETVTEYNRHGQVIHFRSGCISYDYRYDQLGRLVYVCTVDNGNGLAELYDYHSDTLNILSVTSWSNSGAGARHYREDIYDINGTRTHTTNPKYISPSILRAPQFEIA